MKISEEPVYQLVCKFDEQGGKFSVGYEIMNPDNNPGGRKKQPGENQKVHIFQGIEIYAGTGNGGYFPNNTEGKKGIMGVQPPVFPLKNMQCNGKAVCQTNDIGRSIFTQVFLKQYHPVNGIV